MNLSNELIKKLKKDTSFQEFLGYIVEVIEKMDTISTFDTKTSDKRLGEQLRARIVAKEELFKILQPFTDFAEKKEPSKEQINEARKAYGLK